MILVQLQQVVFSSVLPESGEVLNVCSIVKYLGHFYTVMMNLLMIKRLIDSVANCMLQEIHQLENFIYVLQRSRLTPLYTAHMWFNYRKYSMNRLTVAYNDAMRMLLRIPRYMCASQMFAELWVPACQAVCRNLMFKFITRLDRSENSIISYLIRSAKSDIIYS